MIASGMWSPKQDNARALIIRKEPDIPEGIRQRPSNGSRGKGYSRVHGEDTLDGAHRASTAWQYQRENEAAAVPEAPRTSTSGKYATVAAVSMTPKPAGSYKKAKCQECSKISRHV